MRLGCWTLVSVLLGVLAAVRDVGAADEAQVPLKDPTRAKRPNVVFFLTDDQDSQLNSLAYEPHVQKHLIKQGTTFKRHFCTVALCCPSRVNLWTGKAAHNTNVTDVNPPYGGYPKFVSQGLNERYLPVWLQQAGYSTYYTGKLFNTHTVDNYNEPYPAGFTGSDFLLDPFTYRYLNSTWQRNQEPPKSYEGSYTTDVLAEKALGFLQEAADSPDPFFLTVAPVAPHSNFEFETNDFTHPNQTLYVSAPIAAKRHEHLFKDVQIPRTENFNPDRPSGVNWISQLPQQNQTVVEYNDHFYRSRLRALQAVDEVVDGVINFLDQSGLLEDTYIIYTSDNGYHIGQHRLQPGKECGYEEDINVPLIIRGPGVPKGDTTDIVTSHTDLAPTIFDLLGLEKREDFDGEAIPVTKEGIDKATSKRHEHVNVEYWGFAIEEGKYGIKKMDSASTTGLHWNNTYKALRVVGEEYNLYYSVWCNNEHEFYDLNADPYEVDNIYPSRKAMLGGPAQTPRTIFGLPLGKVVSRLDALLLVLKSCKGSDCVRPWSVLHPEGGVSNLKEALRSDYDQFYEVEQTKVKFNRCEQGYIIDAEGPQEALVFRHGLRWSEFT